MEIEVGAERDRARIVLAPRVGAGALAKRTFDAVAAAVLLLVLTPLLAAVALVVLLDSPGGVFFRCERVGYCGRPLRMLKFRKMAAGAQGAPLTVASDVRFTRVGVVLAKYKLDELPQLWHVLRGEMSFVGPRPEDPRFVRRHAEEYYGEILTVRPGLFGLSQLAFADENRILDARDPVADYLERILPQKVRLDRLYVATRGFWSDIRLLVWATAPVIFRRPVSVDRETGALRLRRR